MVAAVFHEILRYARRRSALLKVMRPGQMTRSSSVQMSQGSGFWSRHTYIAPIVGNAVPFSKGGPRLPGEKGSTAGAE